MKKALPIVVVAVIAVLAVGGWMLFGKGKQVSGPTQVEEEVSPGEAVTVTEETPVTQEEEGFIGQIKEAVLSGVPMKCTWKDDKGNSATGYIKGKNYYGEITGEGKTGYLIIKGNCMWAWTKGENQGFKTCSDPAEGDIWDQEGLPEEDYACAPAVVSDSMFNPPADINFFDIEQMMGE